MICESRNEHYTHELFRNHFLAAHTKLTQTYCLQIICAPSFPWQKLGVFFAGGRFAKM